MRKFLMAVPLAAALTFGGCATTGNVDIIAAVQAAAVQACAFLPTATTVANIFAAGDPTLATATAIAEAICAAVAPKNLAKRRGVPTVGGVVIHGRFVR